MQMGTFKFKTLAFAIPEPLAAVFSFFDSFSAFRSGFFGRRTCQTGLLRPTWTPARPGLLGHFLDLDSPAELLREHGALFTLRVPEAPANNLGRVPAFPADLLRENGHIFIFNSVPPPPPPPLVRSFFFPFSLSFSSAPFISTLFFSLFLNMSLHLFDAESVDDEEEAIAGVNSGPEPGSGC